jgi:hypothetical protein
VAKTRTGARSALDLVRKLNHLCNIVGFANGVRQILGADDGAVILGVLDTLCSTFRSISGSDDNWNRLDATAPSDTGGEDIP